MYVLRPTIGQFGLHVREAAVFEVYALLLSLGSAARVKGLHRAAQAAQDDCRRNGNQAEHSAGRKPQAVAGEFESRAGE